MTSRLSRVIAAVVIVLFCSVSLAATDGRVFHLEGKATVNGYPMTFATKIRTGDIIETARNSSVKLILSDHTVLDIGANTQF